MLYKVEVAVCSEIRTQHQHVNILCGQNIKLLSVNL